MSENPATQLKELFEILGIDYDPEKIAEWEKYAEAPEPALNCKYFNQWRKNMNEPNLKDLPKPTIEQVANDAIKMLESISNTITIYKNALTLIAESNLWKVPQIELKNIASEALKGKVYVVPEIYKRIDIPINFRDQYLQNPVPESDRCPDCGGINGKHKYGCP